MRRQLLAVLTTALGASGLGLSAQPASASGLILSLQLTSHQAGTPTGATLHIVYPSDGPGGKPKPVSLGLYGFPRGTTIDEGALPVCPASDAEFDLLGPSACAVDTGLGGGGITVDTGFGPPVEVCVEAYLLRVEAQSPPGPGEGMRTPQWFAPEDAIRRLAVRRDPLWAREHRRLIETAVARLQS